MVKLYLSQSLDALAKYLSDELASDRNNPLQKRWILVPGPLRQWLSIQLAVHGQVLAGCKFATIEEALFPDGILVPTSSEMLCLIHRALREVRSSEIVQFLEEEPKRKLDLAQHLGTLFFSYGLHDRELFGKKGDWQSELLQNLFVRGLFRLPVQFLPSEGRRISDPVHCFGYDYLPDVYWKTLSRFSQLHVYSFSPCIHFWEDVRTEREKRSLFQKASLKVRDQLEQYLDEAPPFLANWGKLGRETLKSIDSFETEEVYASLPEKPSLLHSIQREVLLFEKREAAAPDSSIQIFQTGSSALGELEVVRKEILRLGVEIPFADMAVLAPDIQPYVPLIEFVFSDIPYRISDVDIGSQSSFYQGILRLAALAKANWSAEEIIELMETPAFYRKLGWDRKKIEKFSEWAAEIFQFSGDWEKGFEKMVLRLAALSPEPFMSGIPMGDSDLLEELLFLFQQIRADLGSMQTANLKLSDWAKRWEEVAEKYLKHDPEDECDAAAVDAFRRQLLEMRKADVRLEEAPFPFDLVDRLLRRPCQGSIHGSHLHAVRCGSLEPGSVQPAKAIFLIGMDEEHFPRKKIGSSLDLLKAGYIPDKPDVDRYLFLQALFAADEYLRISYGHLSKDEGKAVAPSLMVQELMSSLGEEISSKIIVESSIGSAEQEIEARFSIRSPEKIAGELPRVVSLADLSLFARHPWKYHLQKVLGIYLEDRRARSFNMQRAPILRASLKWPIDQVFTAMDQELPPGIIGEAFRIDAEDRAEEWKHTWKDWGGDLYSLSFLETAREKSVVSKDRIEFPAIEVDMGNGSRVAIVGEVKQAMGDSALSYGDDSIGNFLKSWPETLAAMMALKSNQVRFLKNGRVKEIADPAKSMRSFLEYYFRCRTILSPLMPDWADALLKKEAADFDTKTEYDDFAVEWILARLEMPPAEALFSDWRWLRDVFSELIAVSSGRGGG